MGRHHLKLLEKENTAIARGSDLRVSFKNTYETARAVKGMTLARAQAYLKAVMEKKEIVPFKRWRYGVGRKAQLKNAPQYSHAGRWPVKSAQYVHSLVVNLAANAEAKEVDTEKMLITHVQVNKGVPGRRRTYRAHGRIGPFKSHPCHIEMVASVGAAHVPAASDNTAAAGALSQ